MPIPDRLDDDTVYVYEIRITVGPPANPPAFTDALRCVVATLKNVGHTVELHVIPVTTVKPRPDLEPPP